MTQKNKVLMEKSQPNMSLGLACIEVLAPWTSPEPNLTYSFVIHTLMSSFIVWWASKPWSLLFFLFVVRWISLKGSSSPCLGGKYGSSLEKKCKIFLREDDSFMLILVCMVTRKIREWWFLIEQNNWYTTIYVPFQEKTNLEKSNR